MLTLANVMPSVISIVTIWAIWLLVANLSYIFFVNKVHVPGLTPLVQRATGSVGA